MSHQRRAVSTEVNGFFFKGLSALLRASPNLISSWGKGGEARQESKPVPEMRKDVRRVGGEGRSGVPVPWDRMKSW